MHTSVDLCTDFSILHAHLIVENCPSTVGRSMYNPLCACPARVTVLGSVCVSVKSHLTYGVSVRPENTVSYSVGKKFVGFSLKQLCCRDAALPRCMPYVQSAIFPAESMHVNYSIYHVVWTELPISSCVLLRRRRLRFSHFVSFY